MESYGIPTTIISLSDQRETNLMNCQFPKRTIVEVAVNIQMNPENLEENRHGKPGKAWFLFHQMAYITPAQAHPSLAAALVLNDTIIEIGRERMQNPGHRSTIQPGCAGAGSSSAGKLLNGTNNPDAQ